jgi:hypothetical protein
VIGGQHPQVSYELVFPKEATTGWRSKFFGILNQMRIKVAQGSSGLNRAGFCLNRLPSLPDLHSQVVVMWPENGWDVRLLPSSRNIAIWPPTPGRKLWRKGKKGGSGAELPARGDDGPVEAGPDGGE